MPTEVSADERVGGFPAQLMELLRRTGDELLEACNSVERELSVLVTHDEGMRILNAKWRGLDEPTDVLSFAFDEVSEHHAWMPIGDIIINLERADLQREEHGLTLEEEMIYLLVHGLCHLRGFDHAEPQEAAAMRLEEERLLALVSIQAKRPEKFF